MTTEEFQQELREADYYDEVRDYALEHNVNPKELKEFSFQGVRKAERDVFNSERTKK